ncbi:hypothetical protein pb186bvf_016654 [Paramecium bursaria]
MQQKVYKIELLDLNLQPFTKITLPIEKEGIKKEKNNINISLSLEYLMNPFINKPVGSTKATLMKIIDKSTDQQKKMDLKDYFIELQLGESNPLYTKSISSTIQIQNTSRDTRIQASLYQNIKFKENENFESKILELKGKLNSGGKGDAYIVSGQGKYLCEMGWKKIESKDYETFKSTYNEVLKLKDNQIIEIVFDVEHIVSLSETEVETKKQQLDLVQQKNKQNASQMVQEVSQIKLSSFQGCKGQEIYLVFELQDYFTYTYLLPSNKLPEWQTNLILKVIQKIKLYDTHYNMANQKPIIEFDLKTDKIFGNYNSEYIDYLISQFAIKPQDQNLYKDAVIHLEYVKQEYYFPFELNMPGYLKNKIQNEYLINNQINTPFYQVNSIHDHILIRKVDQTEDPELYAVPVYKHEKSKILDQFQLKLTYQQTGKIEINKTQKQVSQKNCNYALLFINKVKFGKLEINFKQEYLQFQMKVGNQQYDTSINKGCYFGQEFLINFPCRIDIILIIWEEQLGIKKHKFSMSGSFDPSQIILQDSQYLNIELQSQNKVDPAILSIRLQLGGCIKPWSLKVQPSYILEDQGRESSVDIVVYEDFKIYQTYKGIFSNNKYQFELFMLFSQDPLKKFRFQVVKTMININQKTILQDLQIRYIDLIWQSENYKQFDNISFTIEYFDSQLRNFDDPYSISEDQLPRKFLQFTLLKVDVIQDDISSSKFQSFAVELKPQEQILTGQQYSKDLDRRYKDYDATSTARSVFLYDASKENQLYDPLLRELEKSDLDKYLDLSIVMNYIEEDEPSMFLIGTDITIQEGEFYQEILDNQNYPLIFKYSLKLKHFFSKKNTDKVEVTLLLGQQNYGYDIEFEKIDKSSLPWVKNQQIDNFNLKLLKDNLDKKEIEQQTLRQLILPNLEQSVQLMAYDIQNKLIIKRYIFDIQQLTFNYEITKDENSTEQTIEGHTKIYVGEQEFSLIIKEPRIEQLKIQQGLSFKFLMLFKKLFKKKIKFVFQFGINQKKFSYSLKESFKNKPINQVNDYLYNIKQLDKPPNYIISFLDYTKGEFPIFHSVSKVFLGDHELYLLKCNEIHGEVVEKDELGLDVYVQKLIETRIQVREIYVCRKQEKPFRVLMKRHLQKKVGHQKQYDEEQFADLHETYVKSIPIYTEIKVGYITITFLRLIKGLQENYINRYILNKKRVVQAANNEEIDERLKLISEDVSIQNTHSKQQSGQDQNQEMIITNIKIDDQQPNKPVNMFEKRQKLKDKIQLSLIVKYNHQVKEIGLIDPYGLFVNNDFPKAQFLAQSAEDNMLVQLYGNEILIGEAEVCPALIQQKFIQEVPPICYTKNDFYKYFYDEVNLNNVYLMGHIDFKEETWFKVFIRFEEIFGHINQSVDESNTLYVKVYFKNEYQTTLSFLIFQQQFRHKFEDTEILDILVNRPDENYYLKLDVVFYDTVIATKIISLMPFIRRLGANVQFTIQVDEHIKLNSTIEIISKYQSDMQKPKTIIKERVDFRKQKYQDLLIQILNNPREKLRDGLEELVEFLVYTKPNMYDPKTLFYPLLAIFESFKDYWLIVNLVSQCMNYIILSHYDNIVEEAQIFSQLLFRYFRDSLEDQRKELQNSIVTQPIADDFEITLNDLVDQYPKIKNYLCIQRKELSIDQDSVDGRKVQAHAFEYYLKIIDRLVKENEDIRTQILKQDLPDILNAFKQFDIHLKRLGVYFCMFINTLVSLHENLKFSLYESGQFIQLETQHFQEIFIALWDQIDDEIDFKSQSDQEIIAVVQTLNNLIKILKIKQVDFINLLFKIILSPQLRDDANYKDREIVIGIAVEYFQPEFQEQIKILNKQQLEERELLKEKQKTKQTKIPSVFERIEDVSYQILKQEYQNQNQSIILANILDILKQSLEFKFELNLTQIIDYMKKNNAKCELNIPCIEKFLLLINQKDNLQKLKDKKQTKKKFDVQEEKKTLMKKYSIAKLPW